MAYIKLTENNILHCNESLEKVADLIEQSGGKFIPLTYTIGTEKIKKIVIINCSHIIKIEE